MNMNKQGQATAILVWLALAFITIMFFGVWVFGFNLITEKISGIDAVVGDDTTIGSIGDDTFGVINTHQTRGLHLLAFVMIFISGISILITNFITKAHPVFFVVHLFITIAAVIGSVILSNTYEKLMNSGTIGATLTDFTAASFIMLNLPLWVVTIGIFGAIFLFAGILRDSGAGGSIV
jgi:hypothetical protein